MSLNSTAATTTTPQEEDPAGRGPGGYMDDMDMKTAADSNGHGTEEKVTIRITLINDVPYVWDAAEYVALRRDHRICGFLDGASGKNSVTQTLPVRLSRIEAHYLVKHGIAQAFQIPSLSLSNPLVPREEMDNLKQQRRVEQLEVHRNKRKLQIESMVDKIIEGKRKKGRGLVPDRDTVIQEEMQKVELPFETTQLDIRDPWIKDADYVPCDIPISESSIDKLRYKVFEDFHLNRKYFISVGLKFGGDFLAYPDDPMKTHSEFIILCHDTSRSPMPPFIDTSIRLAQMVRKILLVAVLDETNDRVKYRVMNPQKRRSKAKRVKKELNNHITS